MKLSAYTLAQRLENGDRSQETINAAVDTLRRVQMELDEISEIYWSARNALPVRPMWPVIAGILAFCGAATGVVLIVGGAL